MRKHGLRGQGDDDSGEMMSQSSVIRDREADSALSALPQVQDLKVLLAQADLAWTPGTFILISLGLAAALCASAYILSQNVVATALAGLVILNLDGPMPLWFQNSVQLLAGMAIPLMLLALGHALATFGVQRVKASMLIAVLRLATGFAAGLTLVTFLELEGALRGVVLIQATMPAAVFNFLMAARYDRSPEVVAGAIVVSTLAAFLLMPLLVLFALQG